LQSRAAETGHQDIEQDAAWVTIVRQSLQEKLGRLVEYDLVADDTQEPSN